PPHPTSHPVADAPPLTHKTGIDDVLDALDVRGKNLADFTATVKLTETDTALGNASERAGKVSLQRLDSNQDRMRVTFDTKTEPGGKPIDDKREYLLDKDGWLTERDYGRHLQVK